MGLPVPGLLVLAPDCLLSGTRVAGSFRCARQAVLEERLGGSSGRKAVEGTLLHHLFQVTSLLPSKKPCILTDVLLPRHADYRGFSMPGTCVSMTRIIGWDWPKIGVLTGPQAALVEEAATAASLEAAIVGIVARNTQKLLEVDLDEQQARACLADPTIAQ